jgi:hypothetical protein
MEVGEEASNRRHRPLNPPLFELTLKDGSRRRPLVPSRNNVARPRRHAAAPLRAITLLGEDSSPKVPAHGVASDLESTAYLSRRDALVGEVVRLSRVGCTLTSALGVGAAAIGASVMAALLLPVALRKERPSSSPPSQAQPLVSAPTSNASSPTSSAPKAEKKAAVETKPAVTNPASTPTATANSPTTPRVGQEPPARARAVVAEPEVREVTVYVTRTGEK